MELEDKFDKNDVADISRLRKIHLSEPEYRALKNIAYSKGKSIEEEIERAVNIWRKSSKSEKDHELWSKTEHKFRCFHDLVQLEFLTEVDATVVESAIRKHIHDFDVDKELRTGGCHLKETEIVSFQLDTNTAERMATIRGTHGKSLNSFLTEAVRDFNSRFGQRGKRPHSEPSKISSKGRPHYFEPHPALKTLHAILNKEDLIDLRKNLQLSNDATEQAVAFVIKWKLTKKSSSTIK
ncbi:MAG: hypothetical protein AB7V04_04800 [Desulfomonilaceae bacterium]